LRPGKKNKGWGLKKGVTIAESQKGVPSGQGVQSRRKMKIDQDAAGGEKNDLNMDQSGACRKGDQIKRPLSKTGKTAGSEAGGKSEKLRNGRDTTTSVGARRK